MIPHPPCEDGCSYGGISGEQANKHRHEYCTKCRSLGEPVFTVTCKDCWKYDCPIVGKEELQKVKSIHENRGR